MVHDDVLEARLQARERSGDVRAQGSELVSHVV